MSHVVSSPREPAQLVAEVPLEAIPVLVGQLQECTMWCTSISMSLSSQMYSNLTSQSHEEKLPDTEGSAGGEVGLSVLTNCT